MFKPENFDMMVSRVTCVRTKKSLNMIISCVWMSVFNRENDLCSLKFEYRLLDYITNLTLTRQAGVYSLLRSYQQNED